MATQRNKPLITKNVNMGQVKKSDKKSKQKKVKK